jgi:7-carboxy-7-deazaguanine synthase
MTITDGKYYVSEIFESIQGEGNFAGANALFIRFHFCNLSCTWCDTKYTWLEKSGKYKEYTAEELKNVILASQPYHIIFTGGEPTLYRLDNLIIENKKFHVETNSTIIPTEPISITLKDKTCISREAMKLENILNINWVVSPKMSNSHQIFDEQKFSYWLDKGFAVFKFIIRSISDINEVDSLVETHKINKCRTYIGIEGNTLQSQLQPALVDEIIKHGYNFSPRLHVMLWGAERGK